VKKLCTFCEKHETWHGVKEWYFKLFQPGIHFLKIQDGREIQDGRQNEKSTQDMSK
jgi:hypothetical protein